MAHPQRSDPSAVPGLNMADPTSNSFSTDSGSSRTSRADPKHGHGQSNREPNPHLNIMPRMLTFVDTLMMGNATAMARSEKLLADKERLLDELNAKEMTILKLKVALEREKDRVASLEQRTREPVDDWTINGRRDRPAATGRVLPDAVEETGVKKESLFVQKEEEEEDEDWRKATAETPSIPAALTTDQATQASHKRRLENIKTETTLPTASLLANRQAMPAPKRHTTEPTADGMVLQAISAPASSNQGTQASKRRRLEATTTGTEFQDLNNAIAQLFPAYVFRPLIRPLDAQTAEYGHLHELAPEVLKSLQTSIEAYHTRIQRPEYATRPHTPNKALSGCGFLWMTGCTSSRAWTATSRGNFAYRACFNQRRACFVWSHGEWVVLPLPLEVRNASATYRDAGYYVCQDARLGSKDFPGLWMEERKGKAGRSAADAVSEAGGSEMEEIPAWAVF